jgi:sugar-specific transcriptional regulator TrmB
MKAENYEVTNASSIDQAISVLRNRRFDVMIIGVKLLSKDRARFQSLSQLASNAIKIIVTAYPSALSTIQALTFGADAYIVKPINPEELLKTIRGKLYERIKNMESIKSKEGKDVKTFTSSKIEDGKFLQYLSVMAEELVSFGITANQAKIYIALVTVEFSSASQIATACGIRREEVYRILPDLVNMGIVSKRIGTPVTYSADTPESAIQLLMTLKLKKASEELNSLTSKRDKLITNLKRIEISSGETAKCVESIPDPDKVLERLASRSLTTKKSIDVAVPTSLLQFTQVNFGYLLREFYARKISVRIITDAKSAFGSGWLEQIKNLSAQDPVFAELISLRLIDELPFNAVIFDNSEVIWGKFDDINEGTTLWSNFQFHAEIVKTAFEALWQKAKTLKDISIGDKK